MTVKRSALRAIPLALVAACAFASAAQALVMAGAGRTFVSSTGSDSNTSANCSLGNPCRSLSAAYSVTSAGGEIVALDSAGYGELTISGPVSIVGAGPISITATTGTAGITINAGSGLVILRNLQITGNNAANTTGIQLNSGLLILQNSSLKMLTTGLNVSSSIADVINTDIVGTTTGVSTTGTGVNTNANPQQGPTQVRISGGSVLDNTTAFLMNNPGFNSGNSGQANVSIFLHLTGGTSTSINTDIAGNATLISGTGASCANSNCTSAGDYSFNGSFNQQN